MKKKGRKMKIRQFTAGLFVSVSLFTSSNAATLDVAVDSSPAGLYPHLVTAFASVIVIGHYL